MTKHPNKPGVFVRLLCAVMALLVTAALPVAPSFAQAVDPVARGLAASGKISIARTTTIQRLQRAARNADASNLFDNAVLAGGYVTITDQGSTPAGYPKIYAYSAANVNFTVRGGKPTNSSGQPTRFGARATSILSGNGNLGTSTPEESRISALEFMTDAQSVYVRVTRQTSAGYRIAINGQYVSKSLQAYGTTDAFSNWIILTFASAGNNKVRFESDDTVIYAQVAVAQNKSVWPITEEPIHAAWIGDSFSTGYNSGYGWFGFAAIASQKLGWDDPWALAVSGTGYTSTSPVNFPASDPRRLADLTPGNGITFDVVVVALGGNDTTLTASEVTATLQAIRAKVPNAVIVVLGPWAFTTGPNAATLAKEATISGAVAALNDPMMKFAPMNTDPAGAWLFGTTNVSAPNTNDNTGLYITSDGTHPNKAGHEYLGRRAALAIRAALSSLVAAVNDNAHGVLMADNDNTLINYNLAA